MNLIYSDIFLEHDTGMHPENRKRLESLNGLIPHDIQNGEEFLELIHDRDYINSVKRACAQGSHLDNDTATSPRTFEVASYAVGATMMAAETNDFAIVRPPGHHAFPSRASGFCVFNNIAIATKRLLNEGKRVLIMDFDSHLGDGTCEIFYSSDRVLYWSLHQHPAFPGRGTENEIGMGRGTGYNINVPLPPGSGDDIFLDAVTTLMPVAEQFNPDVVAMSAGFDGHQYDLLLDLSLSSTCYYELGRMFGARFDDIFATLEGGYNVQILPQCVDNFVAGINGHPMIHDERKTDSKIITWDEYNMRMQKLVTNLSDYWKF